MSTMNRKILVSGLAFDFNPFKPDHWFSMFNSGEKADMLKLQGLAKQGWVVTKLEDVHYFCEKQESIELQYAIDYRDEVDQDYFEAFENSGWTHIDSMQYIHLFKANLDTSPFIGNQETRLDYMKHMMKKFSRYSLISVSIFYGLNLVLNFALNIKNTVFTTTMLVLIIVSLLGIAFTVLPFFGYFNRVNKIKKQTI